MQRHSKLLMVGIGVLVNCIGTSFPGSTGGPHDQEENQSLVKYLLPRGLIYGAGIWGTSAMLSFNAYPDWMGSEIKQDMLFKERFPIYFYKTITATRTIAGSTAIACGAMAVLAANEERIRKIFKNDAHRNYVYSSGAGIVSLTTLIASAIARSSMNSHTPKSATLGTMSLGSVVAASYFLINGLNYRAEKLRPPIISEPEEHGRGESP